MGAEEHRPGHVVAERKELVGNGKGEEIGLRSSNWQKTCREILRGMHDAAVQCYQYIRRYQWGVVVVVSPRASVPTAALGAFFHTVPSNGPVLCVIMVPSASTSRQASQESLRDQYHHYIPRFILRRFRVVPESEAEGGNKKGKGKRHYYKPQDYVRYFDFETCRLEVRPVGRVYGVMNLYKDIKHVENEHYLEAMLAGLESSVGVVIKKIHDALERGEIKMKREELDGLCKFLFVMQYRMAVLSGTYYDEGHPWVVEIGSEEYKWWVKRVKEEKGLENPIDIWLYFLGYFLTTPHHAITARAEEAMKRRGASSLPQEDEALEDFPAMDYMGLTGGFYLGILEAAEGCEFVLASNSAGMWEGTAPGVSCVHRLFVIGPRVILLLRKNEFRPDKQIPLEPTLGPVNSSLIDIEMPLPEVEDKPASDLTDRAFSAQNGVSSYLITRLTKEQTENVNLVTMTSVIDSGAVTFRSKEAMIGMFQRYRDPDWRDVPAQKHDLKYATLESQLLKATVRTVKRLQSVLDGIISGEIECESGYNRAYKVYKSACREEARGKYILDTTDKLIGYFSTGVALFFVRGEGSPDNELVETLPRSTSVKVMTEMKKRLSSLKVDRWHDPTIGDILYGAAIVGLLDWLVKNGKDILDWVFPDVQLVASESFLMDLVVGSSLHIGSGQGWMRDDAEEVYDPSNYSPLGDSVELPDTGVNRDMEELISRERTVADEVMGSHSYFEPGSSGERCDVNEMVDSSNRSGLATGSQFSASGDGETMQRGVQVQNGSPKSPLVMLYHGFESLGRLFAKKD
ncbi:hypothetical protein AMATHDRAFT_65006 [Amanita thiersii Skay4041]|uniref:Uncharacterized protein n=1 Tax=Amanita thiersii Skay4041 TaxID=703135 RepID=A0A2A9NDB0_9AGAR|nr:hypothetical protein AMATHDRAFT_65006 [Amanita thiersii Skay4041]